MSSARRLGLINQHISPVMAERTLSGKVAIVSGSSSGIGAAIVRELTARGAHTVVNYPFPGLKAEAEAVIASLPSPSIAVEADMGTLSASQTLVDAAVLQWGKVDIVVNCVALAVNKPFEEQTLEDWDRLVNINGRGTFLLTQASLAHLTKGTGRIVNIVSISGRGPPPNQTIYAGTKGMVDSFTKCWAKELPPKYGCTVNAVSPGPTKTEGFAAAGEEQMRILQPIIDQTPVGPRMAEPDEIAFAVAFLCEERARWINGAHIVASGGLFID
ncbi:NAD(P)-binding protein [Aspergillus ellipticus CBS 707.79]|uniref:NAD(P)-binding protein n=1 Tax=Aspergillus ellipticus CBS 707.79 TaxID=1448320 RepID=A0A319DSV0_9EURO|nr:NAD(P)-binding protein [Aspergillus ellipticus CBS 707.79]